MIEEQQPFPDFNLPRDGGGNMTKADLLGKNAIIYFYPKDNTSGCTTEAVDFTRKLDDFKALNTIIIGVSPDTVRKHDNFVKKYDLKIPLLADTERELIEKLGIWVEKKMYGKTYMGIERTTYLLDPEGIIQKIWRKVRVSGHVDAVLEYVQENMNS